MASIEIGSIDPPPLFSLDDDDDVLPIPQTPSTDFFAAYSQAQISQTLPSNALSILGDFGTLELDPDGAQTLEFLADTLPLPVLPPVKAELPPPLPVPLPIYIEQEEPSTKGKKTTKKGSTAKGTKEKARKRKQKVSEVIPEPPPRVSDDQAAEDKKQQRLMRNRASAQLSRDRKKRYLTQLESQLKELTAANSNLSSQVIRLSVENKTLKEQLRKLEGQPYPPSVGIGIAGDMSPTSSSDPESPLGLPLSPEPPITPATAKRSKKQQAAMAPAHRTQPLYLFAFVVSFGLIYVLLGLFPETMKSSPKSSIHHLPTSRNLLDQSSFMDSPEGLKHLPSPLGRSDSSDEETPIKVVVVNTEKAAKKALHSENTEGYAIDLWQATSSADSEQLSYDDVIGAYKKILLSSNFSLDADANYFFCPSVVQIQSSLFPKRAAITKNETVRVEAKTTGAERASKRLRRVGFPESETGKKSTPIAPATHATIVTTSDNNTTTERKLYLWVPTTSLFPEWADLTEQFEENPRKITGLSEIHCSISSIRPVMI